MSISLKELIRDADFSSLDKEIQDNLLILLERINRIRNAWGKPMTVTSGLRTMADHLRIYASKGITDQAKIPMKSQHLKGAAVDIFDPNQELQKWCKDNEKLLEDIGLWCEDFKSTKSWVHFQIYPYGSWKPGKSRFFIP